MAKRKEGDLRLLKDGRVFGPTDREELDRLLAAGRLTLADHVSVRNADWITIAEFLAAPPAPEPPQAPAAAAPVASTSPALKARVKKGDLRVLSGGRIVSSLARRDVEQLRIVGRIGDDDLISALNGPWMPIRDFLAPPPPEPMVAPPEPASAEPLPTAIAVIELEERAPPELTTIPVPVVPVWPAPPPSVAPSPAAWSPPPVAPVALPRPAAPPQAASYPLARPRPPAPPTSDEWYVRVRGIHSAPLRKHHVKALYQAREITLDCAARHPTWHENDWRPIHSIPQLADITRP